VLSSKWLCRTVDAARNGWSCLHFTSADHGFISGALEPVRFGLLTANGRGLTRLREAGVDVRCGLLRHEAAERNSGAPAAGRVCRGVKDAKPGFSMAVAVESAGLRAFTGWRLALMSGSTRT